MCGIIGYSGPRDAQQVLLEGLQHLEYRGYDSAGIAIVGAEGLQVFKDEGDVAKLMSGMPLIEGHSGIGHTRWATCGRPSKENAHPMVDCDHCLAVVHNGIIENRGELKERLENLGHTFTSETDTEVLVHLLEEYYHGDLRQALKRTLEDVKGTYAIAAVCQGHEEIVAARKENPLIVGLGAEENFLTSDITAVLNYTNKIIYIEDGEMLSLTPQEVQIFNNKGEKINKDYIIVSWTAEDAQKGGFEHYMLKEIFEQPVSIHNSLLGNFDKIMAGELLSAQDISSIKLIACGTSYNASLVGKYAIEALSGIPATVELASECRYSSETKEDPLVILVTQSGETADTLAAARLAKKRGQRTLAITNVVGSTITREVDEVFYTQAGPEIGVAATKTYVTQLMAMYMLALKLGKSRMLRRDEIHRYTHGLKAMPRTVANVLAKSEEISAAVDMLTEAQSVFFLGRHINYPTMLEGALKLKEISYIHAEGYAAGELKHGPLALLDADTPIVASCVWDMSYEKMLSAISEVAARDSPVLGIGIEGDRDLEAIVDQAICIPEVEGILSPLPLTVVVQLIAYHTARKRGCPIDRPKNLAKSVTVD